MEDDRGAQRWVRGRLTIARIALLFSFPLLNRRPCPEASNAFASPNKRRSLTNLLGPADLFLLPVRILLDIPS